MKRAFHPVILIGILSTASLLTALCAAVAMAAPYPSKPVKLIVTVAPGGSNDTLGRVIATKLTDRLGRQVIVENRAGGGGIVGTEMAAKAEPDGHTLLLIAAAQAMQPALQPLPYDPIKSFTMIARVGTGPFGLVVHPSVPARSVQELIALAKQKPGRLIFGTSGAGGGSHLVNEYFNMMANVNIKIVHFKGGGPAIVDLLGGHSHGFFGSLPQSLPHVRSGKLRILATCGEKRSIILPDVPTIAESGVPGYKASQWWAIVAPAGTPQPVVERLNRELKATLSAEDVKKIFLAEGAEVDYLGPKEFEAFFAADIASWANVVKKGNIRLE